MAVTGDFNTSTISTLEKLTDLFKTFALNQHVSTPTHILGSTLDLICTNSTNSNIVTVPLYFTDIILHHFIAAGFQKL